MNIKKFNFKNLFHFVLAGFFCQQPIIQKLKVLFRKSQFFYYSIVMEYPIWLRREDPKSRCRNQSVSNI